MWQVEIWKIILILWTKYLNYQFISFKDDTTTVIYQKGEDFYWRTTIL